MEPTGPAVLYDKLSPKILGMLSPAHNAYVTTQRQVIARAAFCAETEGVTLPVIPKAMSNTPSSAQPTSIRRRRPTFSVVQKDTAVKTLSRMKMIREARKGSCSPAAAKKNAEKMKYKAVPMTC